MQTADGPAPLDAGVNLAAGIHRQGGGTGATVVTGFPRGDGFLPGRRRVLAGCRGALQVHHPAHPRQRGRQVQGAQVTIIPGGQAGIHGQGHPQGGCQGEHGRHLPLVPGREGAVELEALASGLQDLDVVEQADQAAGDLGLAVMGGGGGAVQTEFDDEGIDLVPEAPRHRPAQGQAVGLDAHHEAQFPCPPPDGPEVRMEQGLAAGEGEGQDLQGRQILQQPQILVPPQGDAGLGPVVIADDTVQVAAVAQFQQDAGEDGPVPGAGDMVPIGHGRPRPPGPSPAR